MPFKAVLFGYFHPVRGMHVPLQAPSTLDPDTHFSCRYSLPQQEHFNKVLVTTVRHSKEETLLLMSYPTQIINSRYSRNSLTFSPLFLFDDNESLREYEPVIERFAEGLKTLEEETGIITKAVENARPDSKEPQQQDIDRFQKLMDDVFAQLSTGPSCVAFIATHDVHGHRLRQQLRLSLIRDPPEVSDIRAHLVPLCFREDALTECARSDLACQRIAPFINGCRPVCHVAHRAHMSPDLACRVLQYMEAVGAVRLVDPLLFTSTYVVTDGISGLHRNRAMQRECQRFITPPGQVPLPIVRILALYAAFSPKRKLTPAHFARDYEKDCERMNLRRFLQFGSLYRILRCVFVYPIRDPATPEAAAPSFTQRITRCFDGHHSVAEVCALFGVRRSDVLALCAADPHTILVHK